MKLKLFSALFLIALWSNAQKQPENTVELDSKITDVYLHNTTGISIATTGGGVYGIDGEKGDFIWKFEESGFISGLNSLGQDGGSSFTEIPTSPFGKFNQTVFNIKNGEKIIDKDENGFESIIGTEFIYGKKAILFFAKKDKTNGKLFLVDIDNSKVLWEAAIESDKKLVNGLTGAGGISNFIQNDSRIAFSAGKSTFLINKDSGKVILTEDYDAGKLFFTEDNKSLIAVENKKSSLIGGALKAGLTMGLSLIGKKPIGKELFAFDVNSGEKSWKKPIKLDEGFVDYQFVDNKIFIIHKDGASLYNYNTGEEEWKKQFKKSKVKRLEKTSEGYLVFYKNKKHLVDNTGKKVWKKPEKVIKDVKFEVEDEEEFTYFDYDKGTIFITPYRIEYFEKGNEKRVYKIALDDEKDKLAFDDKNKNVIVLSGKKLYVLNPDKGLGKDQVKKIDFNDHTEISAVEVRDNGYFINSNWEFAITDFEGNVTKKEYFKQPGEGLRALKNIGSVVSGIGAARVTVSSGSEKQLTSSSNFVDSQNTNQEEVYISKYGENFEDISNALYSPERYNAFKSTKNSAFFYTKKNDKKVLLQIDKDSGDVIETYEFGVNQPKYIIDKLEKRIFFRNGKLLQIFSYS